MEVPFTWFATGWYVIGWSEEFEQGKTQPLHYFGEDLVGYRDDDGALASFALTMGTGPTIVQPLTASAAAVRKDGIQARVRLDAMLQAFQGGAQVVDLTGGNSRAGAEDLHRYGGEARMYFRVDVAPAPGTGDTVSAGHDERSGRDE